MSEHAPVLNGLNLIVSDMEAALTFYRLLGLDIPDSAIWSTESGPQHVEVNLTDSFTLEFDSIALTKSYNPAYEGPASGTTSLIDFAFTSRADIDECYAKLVNAGYDGLLAPFDAFWGARYAIITDPDGNQVALTSPRDPDQGSDGPDI